MQKVVARTTLKAPQLDLEYWLSPSSRNAWPPSSSYAETRQSARMLNEDFREFVELLNSTGVEYLIVGTYALAAHGHLRYTGDLNV